MAKSENLDRLASVPLFASLDKKELKLIDRLADEVTAPSGKAIVVEGEAGNQCYVIVEGTVDVSRNGDVISTLGPGDAFGEMSLLDSGTRTATVTATSSVDLLVLGQREFSQAIADVPAVSRKLLAALARRLREGDERVFG